MRAPRRSSRTLFSVGILSLTAACLDLKQIPVADADAPTGVDADAATGVDTDSATGVDTDGATEADADAAIEVPAPTCEEQLEQDPILGAWRDANGGVCEFYSNGRYSDACGVAPVSGFAEDWARLRDGRYYFGRSSLGSHAGECTADVTFDSTCNIASLKLSCNRGAAFSLELTRL